MKSSFYTLIIGGVILLLCTTSCSPASKVPKFVKVGKSYNIDSRTITVLDIDPAGWIKFELQGDMVWMKFDKIVGLREVK